MMNEGLNQPLGEHAMHPNIEDFRSWAKKGDAEGICSNIEQVMFGESDLEVLESLEAVGLRTEFYKIFNNALDDLNPIYDHVVTAPKSVAEESDMNDLTEKNTLINDEIKALIGLLQGSFRTITDNEPHATLGVLKSEIQDEHSQQKVMKQLVELGSVDKKWLIDQSGRTIDGVTELLWEIVGCSRDITSVVKAREAVDVVEALVDSWRQTSLDNLVLVKKNLKNATDWLGGTDS